MIVREKPPKRLSPQFPLGDNLDAGTQSTMMRNLLSVFVCLALCSTASSAAGQAVTFTDDPATAGVTAVKAVHIAELRSAVNTLRANQGLARFPFTDSALTAQTTPTPTVHVS